MKSKLWVLLGLCCVFLCGCSTDKGITFTNSKQNSDNTKYKPVNKNTKTHRVLQFENEHVRVWRTKIMPNQPLKYHRHEGARIIVGLTGGTLKRVTADGKKSDLTFDKEVPYWLNADPPNELHTDANMSKEPNEVIVIEFKYIKSAKS